MGEQGLGSTPALTVLHWCNKLALHSVLLGGKEPKAGGGQCYQSASARGEKNVLPALESWAVGAQLLGCSSNSSCILMELTQRLHSPQRSSLLSCRPAEHDLGFQQRAASPWQEGERDPLA